MSVAVLDKPSKINLDNLFPEVYPSYFTFEFSQMLRPC